NDRRTLDLEGPAGAAGAGGLAGLAAGLAGGGTVARGRGVAAASRRGAGLPVSLTTGGGAAGAAGLRGGSLAGCRGLPGVLTLIPASAPCSPGQTLYHGRSARAKENGSWSG